MQNPRLVQIGQSATELYPHPKCGTIAAAKDGSVWTLWTKGSNQNNPPRLSNDWRLITTYCGAKFRPKQSIGLPAPVARELYPDGKSQFRVIAGRFNLECYLGRVLKDWEVCRHGRGGNSDHSFDNLSVGCQLTNIIDEVEMGRIKTSPDHLRAAIHRLTTILNETTHPSD